MCLAVLTIQGPPGEKKKRKGRKVKAKEDTKGPEEHSLNKRRTLNGGKKRTQFGGPKERKARRACQKTMIVFRRVVFALTNPTKVQARTFSKTKAEERIKKEKARKEPLSSTQMVATPMKLANRPTRVVLDLGCTRSIFNKHAWFYGIAAKFCPSNKSFVFANSETDSTIFHQG